MRPNNTTDGHFWKRVDKRGLDDCWEWQGGKTDDGYGASGIRGRSALAHRVAWEITNGPIPEGMKVCHTCDNPPCCNPAHLFIGTHQDNMRDMFSKGRKDTRGTKNNQAKFTEQQVTEIRERFAKGGILRQDLAREYGVTPAAIGHLLNRRTWDHVP